MVGLNPTQNSFPHRLEWLNRDSITYRENIKKEGTVIRENKNYFLSEKLFARKNKCKFENNFSKLFNYINKDKPDILFEINEQCFDKCLKFLELYF